MTIVPIHQVWLITGIPGVGKSTVARLLAGRMARGVHIEGDRLQEWIVSGGVYPGQEPRHESDRQIALNRRNQCLLARSFAEAGFGPVIDYVVVSREDLAEYQRLLPGLALHLVVLAPGRDVALRRDEEREEKTVAAPWAFLEPLIVRNLGSLGLWIDSSSLTPDETVDCILQSKDRARLSTRT